MTRPPRNPRRAYDTGGNEIEPATVRSTRALGADTIEAFCHTCHHQVIVSLDGMPDEQPIPDIPLDYRLRCSQCGSRSIGVMMDMAAHYDRVRARRGSDSELPADRAILRLPSKTKKAPPA